VRIAVLQVGYDDAEGMPERTERVAALVRELAGSDPDLVVLPELWGPTGFDYARWDELAEPLDGPWCTAMAAAARDLGATLHAGSFVERLAEPGPDGRTLANTSVVFGPDGRRLAAYRKVHRFGFGSGEPKLMEAGTDLVTVDLPLRDGGTVTAGLSTCYDLRFPELYRALTDRGATLFLVPAAWPAARVAHWTLLGQARAVENQAVVVQANTGGTHAGTVMGGHSQVVSARGEVLGCAATTGQERLVLDVDLDDIAAYREQFPVLADRRL
jgi:predicted amidohydrolase